MLPEPARGLELIEGIDAAVREAAARSLIFAAACKERALAGHYLLRCHGLFYGCDDGATARRFNRLLIDSGLIQHL